MTATIHPFPGITPGADPIQDMAKRLGRFEAVFPKLVGYAEQARHGSTEMERNLAASMVVAMVLAANEVIERE